MRSRNAKPTAPFLGEYRMIREFGFGFYDLDEREAEAFSLIYSIEQMDIERKTPRPK